MNKVALVRGAFLNKFEGQNFVFPPEYISIHGFSSMHPLHIDLQFPITRLPSIADLDAFPIAQNFDLYHKGLKYISNRTLGDSQILIGLENHIKQYDLADTADPYYYYSYQLACLRKKNLLKKLIVTYCETIPHNNESAARKKFVKYFTMSQADAFICHTELSKNALQNEGISEDKIEIARLGVDQSRFKTGKKRNSSAITILFVGRLVPEKGIIDLYTAFKLIKKSSRFKNVNLRIIGAGPLKKTLEEHITDDGLESSIKIEEKSYQEMPDVYREADIFCLPSKRTKTWEEQYGMVLVEAMASSLPIITTRSGAIPEVVGEAGILVGESRSEELHTALCRMIDESDFRSKMAEKSAARAIKYFDSKKTAERIGTIYDTVIHKEI